ncbi:hypothetical protein ABK040_011480 [Willaertia magna]
MNHQLLDSAALYMVNYNSNKVHIHNTPQEIAEQVSDRIIEVINQNDKKGKQTVLCLPTGSTPILTYKALVEKYKQGKVSFENVITFNLDEYYPMEPTHKQSYHYFMNENLFNHVNLKKENIHIPDGTLPEDKVNEFCEEYERKIQQLGGFDLALLGIGRTGHVGFNEPGSTLADGTRLVLLDQKTRLDAAASFKGLANVPTSAITQGISTILNSKEIILIATGESKSEIVHKTMEHKFEDPSECPSTFLRMHKNCHYYFDRAASDKLKIVRTPWLINRSFNDWSFEYKKKAVIHLAQTTKKGICELGVEDFANNGLTSLLVHENYETDQICFSIFQDLMKRIALVSPESKIIPDNIDEPVLIFSPHPDDDVISMGAMMHSIISKRKEKLSIEERDTKDINVKVCYMTNGSVSVPENNVKNHLRFSLLTSDILKKDFIKQEDIENILQKKNKNDPDSELVQYLKANVRRAEAMDAVDVLGLKGERDCIFLDLPFYRTGKVQKKPLGQEDVDMIKDLLIERKAKHVFIAADLSDPNGTHRVVYRAIKTALEQLGDKVEDTTCWLYRGAWEEWNVDEATYFIPFTKHQMDLKIDAIFKHQSQKDKALFPGDDAREFWQRARDRNHQTAQELGTLGLPKFFGVEAFVCVKPNQIPE